MLKLVVFETKKIWSYRYIVPAFIVCMALALFPILRMYSYNKAYVKAEREFYAKYAGPLTEKNHMEIAKKANSDDIYSYDKEGNLVSVDTSFIVANLAMDDISYMINYRNIQENIIKKADENAALYGEKGYGYLEKLNRQIVKKYSSYSQPWLISSSDWEISLEYWAYIVPAMIFIMILISGIFTREKESKMDGIICSSYVGIKTVFFSKILTAAFSSFAVMLVFSIAKYIAFYCVSCMLGMNAPLKSLPSFAYSSLNIKLWEAVLLFVFLVSFTAMLFGILFALISSFCKKSLISVLVSFMVLTAVVFDYYFVCAYGMVVLNIDINSEKISSFLVGLRGYAFPMVLDVSRYFDNYYTVSIFSNPVPSIVSSLAIGVLIISFIMAVAFACYIGPLHKKR